MFKFDFDVEEDSAEEKQAGIPGVSDDIRDDRPFKEHTLEGKAESKHFLMTYRIRLSGSELLLFLDAISLMYGCN
ncbi:hypothetical protein RSAG8_13588, partial [Rhizoctonia solani AG-8 WAC10335]